MSTPATMRPARLFDAAAITLLIDQYVPSGMLVPRAPQLIAEQTADFVVATVDGHVIGCAHLAEYSPSLAEVRALAVAPEHRGHGVGIGLLGAVERLAERRGYTTLFAVSSNEAFFRRHGYGARVIPELELARRAAGDSIPLYATGVYAKELEDRAARVGARSATR